MHNQTSTSNEAFLKSYSILFGFKRKGFAGVQCWLCLWQANTMPPFFLPPRWAYNTYNTILSIYYTYNTFSSPGELAKKQRLYRTASPRDVYPFYNRHCYTIPLSYNVYLTFRNFARFRCFSVTIFCLPPILLFHWYGLEWDPLM